MPDINEYNDEKEWMSACVPRMMDEGKDNEQAVAACMNMWRMKGDAAKYRDSLLAVKAVGDWELDVLAVPFNQPDSDGQVFDAATNFMLENFPAPAIMYHHGVEPGKKEIQKKPVIVGKSQKVEVRSDGVHIRVLLDKTLEWAKRIWEAAKQGLAVASSDSISHLARLETKGKTVMYEKNRPGRISVWPLAGVSLWDRVEGNFQPASRYAIALPAMKAIYREAGIQFPDVQSDTNGAKPCADDAARRARVEQIRNQAKQILAKASKSKE